MSAEETVERLRQAEDHAREVREQSAAIADQHPPPPGHVTVWSGPAAPSYKTSGVYGRYTVWDGERLVGHVRRVDAHQKSVGMKAWGITFYQIVSVPQHWVAEYADGTPVVYPKGSKEGREGKPRRTKRLKDWTNPQLWER